jgi:hypothetical protein
MFTGVSASQAINIVAAIDLYPIRPGERAAIYRALALVPGVVAAGRARSLSGLNGVVLGARDPDGAVEDQLILDPRTGAVLGGRTVILSAGSAGLPAGTVRSQTASCNARSLTSHGLRGRRSSIRLGAWRSRDRGEGRGQIRPASRIPSRRPGTSCRSHRPRRRSGSRP